VPFATLVPSVRTTRTRTTSHFLYVPDRGAAERAGKALARAGFHSEAGPAADGDDWLLVATHEAVAEKDREIATQEAMREIAVAVGGHYNGYQVREK
jgi:Regulator of ribonuclease activity B